MNPYQPPAQYPNPQNTYPTLQQDTQARYPQLPPLHNQQNSPPQYPQYPQYPQPQPQIPQGGQNNQQGYVPPSQYALIGTNPVNSDSRTLLMNKMKDIETLFEKGVYWYKIWLYLMVILGGLGTCYALLGIWGGLFFHLFRAPFINWPCVFAVPLAIWLIVQSLSQKKAIEKKDLIEANKALCSFYWLALLCLIFFVSVTTYVEINSYYHPQNWFEIYLVSFIVLYVVPVWIHIAGARKVRNLLERRDALALELDPSHANNV